MEETAGGLIIIGPRREKNCPQGFVNNKGTDQTAHPRSLISVFVMRLLVRITLRVSTGKIAMFKLVSESEQAGLNLTLSEIPKTGYIAMGPNCNVSVCDLQSVIVAFHGHIQLHVQYIKTARTENVIIYCGVV